MSDEDSGVVITAVEVTAAVVSAGAGLALGGPAGAVAGAAASPMMTAGLRSLVDHVSMWRARRAGEAFTLAAKICGLSEDDFALRLGADERLSELAGRVLLTVQDMALPAKRKALAKVLAEAGRMRDSTEAQYEHGLLVVRAIATLDGPHIRIMTVMQDRPGLPDPVPPSDPDGVRWGYRAAELAADPTLAGIAESLMGELLALGLIEDATNGMTFLQRTRQYALTPFGREVLALLESDGQGPT